MARVKGSRLTHYLLVSMRSVITNIHPVKHTFFSRRRKPLPRQSTKSSLLARVNSMPDASLLHLQTLSQTLSQTPFEHSTKMATHDLPTLKATVHIANLRRHSRTRGTIIPATTIVAIVVVITTIVEMDQTPWASSINISSVDPSRPPRRQADMVEEVDISKPLP